jgi:hypothetical protein
LANKQKQGDEMKKPKKDDLHFALILVIVFIAVPTVDYVLSLFGL